MSNYIFYIQNELKRLRENTNAATWNNTTDLNNTWTDILEGQKDENDLVVADCIFR